MNYEERLLKELPHITPADADAMARAAVYQGTLAKPPGSLGALENIYIRLCGISGKLHPVYSPCRIIVLCADNGVVEEGVSVTPRSVTAAQAVNMTNYCTGMSAMAHHFGDEIQMCIRDRGHIVASALDTAAEILETYTVYRERFPEDEGTRRGRAQRLLGMLMKGTAGIDMGTRQEAMRCV